MVSKLTLAPGMTVVLKVGVQSTVFQTYRIEVPIDPSRIYYRDTAGDMLARVTVQEVLENGQLAATDWIATGLCLVVGDVWWRMKQSGFPCPGPDVVEIQVIN